MLGLGFGLAVIIGNTIGAGIFRTPGDIAELLPNNWLFLGVWLIGGLYALLGSIQIANGTMLPRFGGQTYSTHARRICRILGGGQMDITCEARPQFLRRR